MRILLDTTYAARAPYSGTAIYIERLKGALAAVEGVEVLTACNPRRKLPGGGGVASVRNLLVDRRWIGIELAQEAARVEADVIHHPLPALSSGARMAQVVTVHDLSFERMPQLFTRGFRRYAHLAQRAAARGASAVICVSQSTAADMRELWAVPLERVVVAPHGPGQELFGCDTDSPKQAPPAHLLYVGDEEPRKNLPTLIAAYALYRQSVPTPLPLVLAGSANADAPGIRIEPHPSPKRLAKLYAEALALVHPSLYEGFGLTALEAMTAGVPVIAAATPGLLETCGEAAIYCGAAEPTSFATAMTQVATDTGLRFRLSDRGRRRAAEFSWARSARAHVDAYSLAQKRG